MKNKHDPDGGTMRIGPVTFSAVQTMEARPCYVRLPPSGKKETFTSLGRSKLWEILQSGKVKSICLRKPGALRGARLIKLEGPGSLLEYLASMESEAPAVGNDEMGGPKDE
jgi:hypothetical protein